MNPAHVQRRVGILRSIIKANDKVLDVGCGTGSYITEALADLPIEIMAIDQDRASIEWASHHNTHSNVRYQVAVGEDFFTDEHFDVIICSHILEHNEMPSRLLSRLWFFLKDDGVLFLAIPNGYGCFEIENFIPQMLAKTGWGKSLINRMRAKSIKDSLNYDDFHVQHFTMGKIDKLLQQTRWRIGEKFNEQVVGGVITDRTLLKSTQLAKWNMKLGDRVPACMANGWIFICEKQTEFAKYGFCSNIRY